MENSLNLNFDDENSLREFLKNLIKQQKSDKKPNRQIIQLLCKKANTNDLFLCYYSIRILTEYLRIYGQYTTECMAETFANGSLNILFASNDYLVEQAALNFLYELLDILVTNNFPPYVITILNILLQLYLPQFINAMQELDQFTQLCILKRLESYISVSSNLSLVNILPLLKMFNIPKQIISTKVNKIFREFVKVSKILPYDIDRIVLNVNALLSVEGATIYYYRMIFDAMLFLFKAYNIIPEKLLKLDTKMFNLLNVVDKVTDPQVNESVSQFLVPFCKMNTFLFSDFIIKIAKKIDVELSNTFILMLMQYIDKLPANIADIVTHLIFQAQKKKNVDYITNISIIIFKKRNDPSLIYALIPLHRSGEFNTSTIFNKFVVENRFNPSVFSNLDQITGVMEMESKKNISSTMLIAIERFKDITRALKNIQEILKDMNYLHSVICHALELIPLENINNPIPKKSVDEVLNTVFNVKLDISGTVHSIDIHGYSLFGELEGFIDKRRKDLKDEVENKNALIKTSEKNNKNSLAVHYFTKCIFDPKDVKKHDFTIEGQKFTATDNILQAVLKTMSDPNDLKETIPDIHASFKSGNAKQEEITIEKSGMIFDALDAIREIHRLFPNYNYIFPTFITKVIKAIINNVSGSITGTNYVTKIVTDYPFLFPLNIRYLCAFLTYTNPQLAGNAFSYEYEKKPAKDNSYELEVICEKDTVFDIKAFTTIFNYTKNPFLKVSFTNNYFTYDQFIYSFSEYLTKKKDLWNKEYHKNGVLLFAPYIKDENKGYLKLFGLLVGRAILFRSQLSMKIHPVMFSMVLGRKINIEKEIPELYSLLSEEWIDQPFTYPGYPRVDLGSETKVNDNNFGEFKQGIISYTCGDKMINNYIKIFKHFLLQVISDIDMLKVFTSQELSSMLYGGEVNASSFNAKSMDHSGVDEESFKQFERYLAVSNPKDISNLLYRATGLRTMPFGDSKYIKPAIRFKPGVTFEFDMPKRIIYIPTGLTLQHVFNYLNN